MENITFILSVLTPDFQVLKSNLETIPYEVTFHPFDETGLYHSRA